MAPQRIQQTIAAYTNAYNAFEVAGMLATLHPSVRFKNKSGDRLALQGKSIFRFKDGLICALEDIS